MNTMRLLDLSDDGKELATDFRGPAPYPISDAEPETKYTAYSLAILEEQKESMEALFQVWTQNLLFLGGLQWWTYDRLTGSFAPPRGAEWRERPVANLLVPYFKHVMAKVTKTRPAFNCIGASTDPEDLYAAQLGNDVLKAKWQELHLSATLRRIIAWVIPTGNGYLMPYWNLDSGLLQPLTTLVQAAKYDAEQDEPVGVEMVECPCDENGDPILDESGAYDLEAEPAWIDIGEVGFKVLSPFQVFVDPGAQCEEDVTFVLIAEPMTVREAHRRWPDATDIQAEDTGELQHFDAFISGMAAGADTHLTSGLTPTEDSVPRTLVLHYHERRSQDYPQGRHWVTCGSTILENPGPLPDGIWPVLVHFRDMEVPGRYHAEATMTAAVGLQREYNEVNGQIKEHHNLLLRGKWLVPIGSNIRRGQITTRPGEVIQHTPGLPPVMADLKPLPAAVYGERQRILDDFQLITGLHKISMGTPPPGVTSGRAFLTLQEADDSDQGPFTEMLEQAVALLGWLTLQIIQQSYEEERLLRVSGENNRYRVRAFKGADLSAIVDVEPQVGSAFPWSAVAKQSMMIELAETIPQLFEDPETGGFDHERFRQLLPIGGMEAVGVGADLDIAEALREEEEIETWDGVTPLPPVMPWQNHVIHLRQHGRTLKGASVRSWPPPAQQALAQHWVDTSLKVQQIKMQALMAQMQMQGGGPPGPDGAGNDRSRTPPEEARDDVERTREEAQSAAT